MKPQPGKPIPPGCAVVLKDCTFGEQERVFRASLSRNIGHIVKLPDVKRWSPPRSNQQLKTVMGFWMGIILKETGHGAHEKNEVYAFIKSRCWYEDKVSPNGEPYRIGKPTRDMDKGDYSKEFMEAFRLFVLDFFNIHLPDPDAAMAFI